MTTWVASDIHLNHLNILKYCPHRGGPETSWEKVGKMNETIISNWNSVVQPEDEVWILGDVAMGQIEKAPALVRRLNGTKHLVKGNHDKTIVKLPEANELFATIATYYELNYKMDGDKHLICMSHFPMMHWNGQSADINRTSIHLHGHMHSSPDKLHRCNGAILDVGIDGNNLFPRKMDDAIKLALNHAKLNPSNSHHS